MCQQRNKTEIIIRGRKLRVDSCIAKLIEQLNKDIGMTTFGCCCGHGKYPLTIVVSCFKGSGKMEFCSNQVIERSRRFYKKDPEGYYYIEESLL